MTKTQVKVGDVGFGDTIFYKGHSYLVNSISEPDLHGTFDLYLLGSDGIQVHEVVCESVELWSE